MTACLTNVALTGEDIAPLDLAGSVHDHMKEHARKAYAERNVELLSDEIVELKKLIESEASFLPANQPACVVSA